MAGDSISVCLWNYWKPSVMNSYDKALTTEEIKNIYLYLKNESGLQSIDTNEVEYVLDCRLEVEGDPDDPNTVEVIYRYVFETNQDTKRVAAINPRRIPSLEDTLYYEFEANEFGWFNIDYFLRSDSSSVVEVDPFEVRITSPVLINNLTVLIVFKERNIVIPLFRDENFTFVFGKEKISLPLEDVYLIGIGKEKEYWFGNRSIAIDEENSYELKLSKSSKEGIFDFIESL